MKYTGQLVTGDFKEDTMTFKIEGEMTLQAGRYSIEQIQVGNQVKNLGLVDDSNIEERKTICPNCFDNKVTIHNGYDKETCLKCGFQWQTVKNLGFVDVSEREDVQNFIRMVLNSYKLINNETDHRQVYQIIIELAEKLNNKLIDYANAP